ncbi:breast cancer type 1 susceptibility protein homolog isoform X2 [Electrophorus electricus]|uniref:breast cancer type 1 susceptibility protein homolog isoform X2 n=1 Tax=Electrophorus electricus TaxID=8005 RepID=UPI0015D0729C|nr:breast cancer type 1 susceptibility protein homolog isoform X2 [Electrophorus electricus]
MTAPNPGEVKRGICVIWENLQCPICLDLMSTPVSTRCDHQFCKFCIMKLLERSKRKEACCPVCKMTVTKRSLQESPGFQRLVEGLQNLIQSYEFDTCTNYFTGMPQKRKVASVETESRDQNSIEENKAPEDDGMEKAQSPSSSAAAKDAFARLMGLEDSCSADPQQDCSDSDLGYLPRDCEKKQTEPEDFLSEREDRLSNSPIGLNDGTSKCKKPSGLRSQSRVGLESDRIVDKRQKKSLEKVSEWLMKISPSSHTQMGDNRTFLSICNDSDSEKDSICSSAPTEVVVKANDKVNPSREAPGQCLEKQIFGAVYKRERTAAKTRVSRAYSPEREIMTTPCPLNVVEKERRIRRHVSKKQPSGKLSPADFIKKLSSDDKADVVHEEPMESAVQNIEEAKKQGNCAELNSNMLLKRSEENEKLMENCTDGNGVGTMENSPEFYVPVKRKGRQSKVKMKDAWQNVDCDLKVNNSDNVKDRKRRMRRNNCESTEDEELEESKNVKYTRPLALVSAGTETDGFIPKLTSKPKITEAEVTIESYPSSAEQQLPDSRKTRRSLRLQAFTAEVQGPRERRRSVRVPPKPADKPASDPSSSFIPPGVNATNTRVDNDANQGKASPAQFQSRTADEQSVKRNGCVYNSDFQIIETVQSSEEAAPLNCITGEIILDENSSVSAVLDTMDFDRQHVPASATVVSLPDPLAAGSPRASVPDKHQESPSAAVVAPPAVQAAPAAALMPAGQSRCVDEEGETNDSELDTEQLLKTFKATKRKSFCLRSPTASLSKGQESALGRVVEDKLLEGQGPDTACRSNGHNTGPANVSHSDLLPLSNQGELSPSEKSSQMSHGSLGNAGVVSVTQYQASSSALALGSEEHALLRNSGVSSSPALSPNKVTKPSQDSRHPGNSEMVYHFQLFSASVTEEETQICSDKSTRKDQSPGACLPKRLDISQENQGDNLQSKSYLNSNKASDISVGSMTNSGVHSNHWESSTTPDGLVPGVTEPLVHQIVEPAAHHSSEMEEEGDVGILSQPCVRRKRKAQRLNSSESELSAEDDYLPSLAQIFRSRRAPFPSARRPLQESDFSNQLKEQRPKAGLDSASHQSHPLGEAEPEVLSGHVSPAHKQDAPENVNATATISAGQHVLPHSCRDECITSSQGSVDLFGTPEESEAVDDGFGNAGPSMDLSQYSSEIINTQQREEMQQELCRLRRMMAVVSEALQHSDSGARPDPDDPGRLPSDHSPGADLREAAQHEPERQPDRLSGPHSAPGPACLPQGPAPLHASNAPHIPHTWPPVPRAHAKKGLRSGQRSGNSERLTTQSEVALEVKGLGAVSEGAPAVSEEEREKGRPCGGVAQPGVCRPGRSNTADKMELVASGLTASELGLVKKFVMKRGGSLSRQMTPSTTHVIIKTDGDLVCERTLKYFQGIAGRKWVVSFLWILECFKQGKVLDEALFEVRGDVVNGHEHNGPRKSRTAPDNNLLMKAYEICFQGSFTDMTTDQMEDMVRMCGASVIRDPLFFTRQGKCQLVVVQPASDDSQSYYRALQMKATVVTRSWLLDTIATYTLQNPEDYKP